MPVKTKEVEKEDKLLLPDADIHHVVRTIGVQATPGGAVTGGEADDYIRGYLRNGYRLAFVQSLGMTPEGIQVLYILIRDA